MPLRPWGKNRWRAPQPVENWEGIYRADRFRGRCPQERQSPFYYRNCGEPFEEADEDCLYLNVWTPAESPEEKLPVFLWIHGGANVTGWGHFPFVDGEGFAKRGVIFVSFNWRVNVFGWLTHPELDAENERHVSGNYAVLDQIQALKWVRNNIAAFGGDPDNITVAGESAGGSSTMNLCCTPLTRGMFRHASMQSGGGWDLFVSNSVPSPGPVRGGHRFEKALRSGQHSPGQRASRRGTGAALFPPGSGGRIYPPLMLWTAGSSPRPTAAAAWRERCTLWTTSSATPGKRPTCTI